MIFYFMHPDFTTAILAEEILIKCRIMQKYANKGQKSGLNSIIIYYIEVSIRNTVYKKI